MLAELRTQMRVERAPGDSARGAVAKAKRVVELRYGSPGHIDYLRNIEAECLATCRTDRYVRIHTSECIAHKLERARAEVERKDRMCRIHNVPDRMDCGQCFPKHSRTQTLPRGW